jgi:hypothetical protein
MTYHDIRVLIIGGSIRTSLIVAHARVESLSIQQPTHSFSSSEASEGSLDPHNESNLFGMLHVLPLGVEVIRLDVVRVNVLLAAARHSLTHFKF